MIKLIATDLDGTLFYPKNRFYARPKKNRVFLQKFIDQGGKLCMVSGRNVKILPSVRKGLKRDADFIGCNGGYIKDENGFHDRRPLDRKKRIEFYEKYLPDKNIQGWVLFDQFDFLYFTAPHRNAISSILYYTYNYLRLAFRELRLGDDKRFANKRSSSDCVKMMMIFGVGKKAKQKAERYCEKCKKEYGDFFSFASSSSALEVTAPKANKGDALLKYCERHNIKPEEVLVCGDSGNDLTRFSKFPHSFARSQASDSFKAKANHVIKHVCDLQKYLDNPELMENDTIKN